MANDYYAASSETRHTTVRAESVNAERVSVEAGFALLPSKDSTLESRITYAVDTGTADTYVVALTKPITAYTDGLGVTMKAITISTGAATLNVDGLGARSIKMPDGTDPQAGAFIAGGITELRYDGTNFIITSALPGTVSPGYNPAAVVITGGTITGITDLAIADGGTGASTAVAALAALGGLPLTGGTLSNDLLIEDSGFRVGLTVSCTDIGTGSSGVIFKHTGSTDDYSIEVRDTFGDLVMIRNDTDNVSMMQIEDHDTAGLPNANSGVTRARGDLRYALLSTGVTLTGVETLTNKTLTLPQINDTSSDQQYIFAVSELAADRTVTLPLLTGNDTFTFDDFTATLTNKTLTSPTINTPTINAATITGVVTSSGKTTFTGGVLVPETTLTDAVNISWDARVNQTAKVTLTANRTLDNPTNMDAGATYTLRVIQDAGGANTLVYGTAYLWPGGTAPVLTGTGDAIDIITFVSDGTNMYGSFLGAFA